MAGTVFRNMKESHVWSEQLEGRVDYVLVELRLRGLQSVLYAHCSRVSLDERRREYIQTPQTVNWSNRSLLGSV